ncbi:MAG: hypothetical protein JST64_10795 [Actinobacteria bacterium]|nr:hypothetical protein [Actinomycetota bacterium]
MTGPVLVSVFGAWAAALVAAFIARRLNSSYGVWALWLAGIGSPLFFDAYIVVAHTLAATCAGLAFLGVSRALEGGRKRHLLYALPAVAAVTALRSEGAIFSAALGATVLVMSLGLPPLRRIRWRSSAIGLAVLVVGACTFVADKAFAAAIVGTRVSASPLSSLNTAAMDPVAGAWASLLRPFYGGWESVTLLLPLLVLGVWLAAVALRLLPSRPLLPLVALVASAAASVGLWFWPPGLVTGLLVTSPLVIPGLVWLRRHDLQRAPVTRSLLVVGSATVGILLLNYRVGGAAEWGGRFFHLLLPILLAVVVLGLDNARRVLTRREAWVAGTCLVVVTASIAGAVVTTQVDMRRTVGDFVDGTVAAAHRLERQHPEWGPLVVAPVMMEQGGVDRYFWNQDVELLASTPIRALGVLLDSVAASGRTRMLITTNVDPARLSVLLPPRLSERGWRITGASSTPGGSGSVYLLEKEAGTPKDGAGGGRSR